MKRKRVNTSDQQVLLDHVRELQVRLLVCAIVLVVGGVIGYILFQPILELLRTPLGTDLYYSAPSGSFSFVMKVATMVGIGIMVPVIVYQLIMFIRPALQDVMSIKRVVSLTILSVFLAAAGAAFGFYFIVPGALHFFAGFQVSGLSALISADSYLSFVTNVLITFMVVFQIPLIMIIIDRIKPIPPKSLFKAEKFVILGGLLVSFFVPFAMDITTSLLIATPIIVLYNFSVAMIIGRHAYETRRARRRREQAGEDLRLDDQILADIIRERRTMTDSQAEDKLALLNPMNQLRAKPTRVSDIRRTNKTTRAIMDENVKRERARVLARRQLKAQKGGKPISDIR